MQLQVLSSGSEGNALLLRAGEMTVLVDAGLGMRELGLRFESARVGPRAIQHVLVTHGHLDHARSAGIVARRQDATLHGAECILRHRSLARAGRRSALPIGRSFALTAGERPGELEVLSVPLPHDCDPTVAFRLSCDGRTAVVLTDAGRPDPEVARRLRVGSGEVHVLVLEFNHDVELMEQSPYPFVLRRRITGERGHLSNDEGARMLELLIGPELHTLVLAHLSKKTNRPDLAEESARRALERLGAGHVRVLVASQDEIGPALQV